MYTWRCYRDEAPGTVELWSCLQPSALSRPLILSRIQIMSLKIVTPPTPDLANRLAERDPQDARRRVFSLTLCGPIYTEHRGVCRPWDT